MSEYVVNKNVSPYRVYTSTTRSPPNFTRRCFGCVKIKVLPVIFFDWKLVVALKRPQLVLSHGNDPMEQC